MERRSTIVDAFILMLVAGVAGAMWPCRTVPDESPSAALAPKPLVVAALCALLAGLFAAGIGWTIHGAQVTPFVRPFGAIPIVVAKDFGILDGPTSDAQLVIALAECLVLFALYRALRGRAPTTTTRLIVTIAGITMIAAALASPVMNSSDLYAYVAYGLAPDRAYAPGDLHFSGAYAVIDALLSPIPRSVYGPLWVALAHVAVATPFTTLYGKLIALRGLEVAALAGALVTLRAMRVRFEIITLLALNPAVLNLWIVDGHNDLFGVALLLGAMASRNRMLAVAFVVAAGLVKLPLAVLGAVAFNPEARVAHRVGLAAFALAIACGVTYAAAGPSFFTHLASLGARARPADETALQLACVTIAVTALAAAVARRTYARGLAWIWPALAAYPAAWYGIWGFPYALAGGAAAAFLIAEPFTAFVFSWNYAQTPLGTIVVPLAIILPLGLAFAQRARWQRRPR